MATTLKFRTKEKKLPTHLNAYEQLTQQDLICQANGIKKFVKFLEQITPEQSQNWLFNEYI